MTRFSSIAACLVALAGAIPGCASYGPDATRADAGDRGTRVDGATEAGPVSVTDAAAADGSSDPGADAAPPPRSLAEDACFDFTDDDRDGDTDCSDIGCMVSPVCCATGSTSPSCCRGGVAASVRVGECVAGSAAGCGAIESSFGTRAPLIVAGITRSDACGASPVIGLEPGGTEDSDAGVLVGAPLDPTVSLIRLHAVLGARTGRSDLDAIAFGLTAQSDIDGRVLPLVAVLLSATDAELRVLVGDVVVASLPLDEISVDAACGASELHVLLEVRQDATFTASVVHPVTGFATELGQGTLPAARMARVVVFGRGTPAGVEGPTAWLSSLEIDRQVCSITDPGRDENPVLGVGWTIAPRSVGRVTVLPSHGLAAVLIDGRIYPGALDGTGNVVVPDPGVANAIVRPAAPYASGVSGPELVVDGTRLYLLFAGRATPGGPDTIYSLPFGSFDLGDVAGPAQPLLGAGEINAAFIDMGEFVPAPATSVDSPSLFVHGGRTYLLVRVHTTDGGTELRLLERFGGLESAGTADANAPAGVTRADSPRTTRFRLHANRAGTSAFDRDEVGAAHMIDVGDGVVRVLYAGRAGTRWSIGMLVSADLVHFDFARPGGAPVLGGDGVGFDALSVLDPEPVSTIVAPGVAELAVWYSGSDGLRTRVGLASQAIAVVGAAP